MQGSGGSGRNPGNMFCGGGGGGGFNHTQHSSSYSVIDNVLYTMKSSPAKRPMDDDGYHIVDKDEALKELRKYAEDWKDTRVWLYEAITIACDALEREIKRKDNDRAYQ